MDRREARVECVKVLLGMGYEWLARDKDGTALCYDKKPFKIDDDEWTFDDEHQYLYLDNSDDINFVKWEDEEPVNIREWLEKEEKEMKMYSVKDGELQCKEVDADFFKKYTTLGGLLSSDEVELDRDNKIVPDSVGTIQVTTRNWGKSAILEKAKEIREALEMATTGTSGRELGMKKLGEAIEKPTEYYPEKRISEAVMHNLEDKIIADMDGNGDLHYRSNAQDGIDNVELDNEIVTDGRTIKVTAENSGNSAFYEMAEKFREALDMATEYGYKPSVSIVADNYTWGYNLPILDFKPMYPEQLTLDDLNNVQIHGKVCKELTETYEKKNADYGNSFENSLDKHGMIAGIVRMDDKMSRLISLNSKNEQQVMDESMRDTLMDLANYAIMSVMWLDEQ